MSAPSVSVEGRPDIAEAYQEIGLLEEQNGFIASRVFPVFETGQQSGSFATEKVGDLLKYIDPDRILRGAGGGYERDGATFEKISYSTDDNGFEYVVDDRDAAVYRDWLDAELAATERARHVLMLGYEIRLANYLFNATTFSGQTTAAGGTGWGTAGTATPIADLKTAKTAIYGRAGVAPNALVMSWNTWQDLIATDDIKNRVSSQNFMDARVGTMSTADVASVLGVDQIIVGSAVKNTATEGQTASLGSVWNDTNALVCKIPTSGSLREPCLGRTFHWGGDGSAFGGAIEQYGDNALRGQVYRARQDIANVTLQLGLGQLLTSV